MTPASIIRDARRAEDLTQQQLAERLGTTQSAVAQLESEHANPRFSTLEQVLRACGRELSITAARSQPSIDETQVVERLRMTPAERLKAFERSYAEVRKIAIAAAQARGELA